MNYPEVIRIGQERRRGPAPESEWNALRLWRRVPGHEVIYIPRAYPMSAPRGEKEGAWVADRRDGKRFFVPHAGVPGFPRSVLQADAVKVTNWQKSERLFPTYW